jgi:hypothetical protein
MFLHGVSTVENNGSTVALKKLNLHHPRVLAKMLAPYNCEALKLGRWLTLLFAAKFAGVEPRPTECGEGLSERAVRAPYEGNRDGRNEVVRAVPRGDMAAQQAMVA